MIYASKKGSQANSISVGIGSLVHYLKLPFKRFLKTFSDTKYVSFYADALIRNEQGFGR